MVKMCKNAKKMGNKSIKLVVSCSFIGPNMRFIECGNFGEAEFIVYDKIL